MVTLSACSCTTAAFPTKKNHHVTSLFIDVLGAVVIFLGHAFLNW